MKLSSLPSLLKKRFAERRSLILLLAILILGGILRFYEIDQRCLSGDGVSTVDIVSGPSVRAIWDNVTENYRPDFPLFYLILHFWSLLGNSLFWLRSLSVLSSIALIWVAYRFARYLFDQKTALLTAYFVSISPLLILHGRSVRYYSLNSLFNLLALYSFFLALRTNRNSRWLLYVITRTAAVYINYSSFLFFIPEYLYLLIYRKKYAANLAKWFVFFGVMAILWLPIFIYLFRDFELLATGDGFSRVPIKIGFIGNILYFFFSFSLGQTIPPFNFVPVVSGLILYSCILLNFARGYLKKKFARESINFVLVCLFAVVFLCAISNYNSPYYIKAAAVLFSIIASLGILNLPKRMGVLAVFAITIMRGYSIYNIYAERQYHLKEYVDDWDEISAYVNGCSGKKARLFIIT